MKKFFSLLMIASLLTQGAYASKIQQQGIKTSAECATAGATDATCLPLTSQIYDSTNAQQLSTSIANGQLGGGGGGVNFIGQSTTWLSNAPNDKNLDASVGNWLAFADAASALPVDLTGGSPSVTCTRTTTDPLNGAGSLLIAKGASNLQGNGCSVVFNVQPSYQGAAATITASLQVVSGSLVQGDVKFFVYDVTNSQLITPFNNDVVVGPTLTATFSTTARASTPANQQYRLGIYFASTSATAVTLKADDFSVSPGVAAYGAAGSDWASYPLVIGATTTAPTFGTITVNDAKWRRVGDSMEIQYSFVQTSGGTAGTGVYLFPLPTGYAIDTAKFDTTTSAATMAPIVGNGQAGNTNALDATTVYQGQVGVRNSTNLYMALKADGTNSNMGFSASNAGFFSGACHVNLFARVPIVGWSSNVTMAQSSQFKISSYLANGTRVTSDPVNLGEYRARYKSGSSSNTFTDVAPTTLPTAADGLRLHAVSFSAAQTSGLISLYDVFVGKNKSVRFDLFSGAGHTGMVSYALGVSGGTLATISGTRVAYDPTTGIASVDAGSDPSGLTSARFIGEAIPNSSIANGYAEITVSENALAVGMGAPIYAQYTGNAGTVLVANTTNIDFATKVADSNGAWNGTTFTASRSGWFDIKGSIKTTGSASVSSIFNTYVNGTVRYAVGAGSGSLVSFISGGVYLNSGDVLSLRCDSIYTLSNSAQYHTIAISSQGTN